MTIASLITSGRIRRAFLIAATLLVVQTAAAAHELQHALHHDNNPLCAMHLFANHAGKAPTTAVVIPLPAPPHEAPIARVFAFDLPTIALGYYTRGPPSSS